MDETQCKFFIGVHIITSKRKTGKTLEKKNIEYTYIIYSRIYIYIYTRIRTYA